MDKEGTNDTHRQELFKISVPDEPSSPIITEVRLAETRFHQGKGVRYCEDLARKTYQDFLEVAQPQKLSLYCEVEDMRAQLPDD